jgi:diacylglycerol diphosphate phosphatase / phosphatidate phosphatase
MLDSLYCSVDAGPVLIAGSVWVPLFLVTVGELIRNHHRMVSGNHRRRRRRPFYAIAAFLVTIGVTEGLTQLLKLTIRRKRPNYYALCGFVVTTRQCTADVQHIREAQYSFPSGHSSLSAAAAIFCLWFFVAKILAASSSSSQSQSRGGLLSMPTQRLAVATIVTIGLSWTVTVGTTRLVDRWHHPSDVLAGWLLGGLVATIIYHLYYHPIWHPTQGAVPLC